MKTILIALLFLTQAVLGQIIQSPLDVNGKPHFEFPKPNEQGYYEGDIELPRLEKGGLIIVDGQGAELRLGQNSNGITTPVPRGESPLAVTRTQYIIKNFSKISGGRIGIDLSATFGSVITNVQCVGQSEVGIRLGFCLMCEVSNVLITNPQKDGIYVGIGQFPGWTTASNAQCNNTTLDRVRVYNSKQTSAGTSFTVVNSNGVSILNSVSEGHPNSGFAIDYQAQNSTVKHFLVRNFHIESVSMSGAIRVNAQANTINVFEMLYVQKYGSEVPVFVIENNSPTYIRDIGWWNPNMWIHSLNFAPRITIDDCHPSLNYNSLKTPHARGIYKPYIWINGQRPR